MPFLSGVIYKYLLSDVDGGVPSICALEFLVVFVISSVVGFTNTSHISSDVAGKDWNSLTLDVLALGIVSSKICFLAPCFSNRLSNFLFIRLRGVSAVVGTITVFLGETSSAVPSNGAKK